jgi:hypothetical protein
MFILLNVTSWADERDSAYRVSPVDETLNGYRTFFINPNRISDLIVGQDNSLAVPRAWFKFFDNHLDRRERWSYIKANIAVATIIATADTALASTMATFPICRNNNPDGLTVDTTLPWSCIAYFDRYNPRPTEFVWMVYYNAAFKRREVLVKYNIEQIEDIAETGSTTTTSTTTETTEQR